VVQRRIITGCFMGAAFVLVANYLPPVGVWVLLAAVSCLAQIEFYSMVTEGGIPVFRILGLVCGVALISATFATMGLDAENLARAYRWEHLVLLGSLIAVFLRQFPQKRNDQPLATIAFTLLGIWYVPYLFNYFTRLALGWDAATCGPRVGGTGRMLVLYLVVVVKCSDITAYFAGSWIGRHKLFPRVSPQKTWEGLLAGMIAAVTASLCFWFFNGGRLGSVPFPWGHAVVVGCLLAAAAAVGDIFESLLKRACGSKDSGSAIPGMGGFLDILDSLLFGAPLLYTYVKLFLS